MCLPQRVKAQRKPLDTRQRFAPLRLCGRNLLLTYFRAKPVYTNVHSVSLCAFCAFLWPWNVLRERFDDEIESQPQTPTVMVKGHWKDQRHHKQQDQNTLVVSADNQE